MFLALALTVVVPPERIPEKTAVPLMAVAVSAGTSVTVLAKVMPPPVAVAVSADTSDTALPNVIPPAVEVACRLVLISEIAPESVTDWPVTLKLVNCEMVPPTVTAPSASKSTPNRLPPVPPMRPVMDRLELEFTETPSERGERLPRIVRS